MYLTLRFYIVLGVIVLILAAGYVYPLLFAMGKWLMILFLVFLVVEYALLYYGKKIKGYRIMSERFSNGDENEVKIRVESSYPYPVRIDVIDEIPVQFQRRDIVFRTKLKAGGSKNILYRLRPVRRGVYEFGAIQVFVSLLAGFIQRRYTIKADTSVKVYPSYQMLNQYEILAISNNLKDFGIKKIRRAGHNTEFEQIKDYVQGDDFRTINWKATARRHHLMVNIYQDERSQQIFNVIDKGRMMQQSFYDMTFLDYAINASLVLSYVAMNREDKAGLVTFSGTFDTYLPASNHQGHLQTILESLYKEATDFSESDFSALTVNINKLIGKRSLLVLYTNFSSMIAMKRQLPYLLQLNRRHRLLVVFFQDNELKEYITSKAKTNEDYYQHIIAEKFVNDQRLISSTLQQYGIYNLLTTPQQLSIDVINKYLELKSRQIIS